MSSAPTSTFSGKAQANGNSSNQHPLTLPEYQRYGRQMILPGFGLEAQLRLRYARVLVVGAGGLGCPVIQQLASVGVGYISVLDHDTVEMTNLARQFLHTEDRIGMPKAQSATIAAQMVNPHIHVEPLVEYLNPRNAVVLTRQHDLIIDCTDNPTTRYILSDAAVLADKMLVSGAAQGMEGQLAVWNRYLDPAEHVVPPLRYAHVALPQPTTTSFASETLEASNVLPETPTPTQSIKQLRTKRLASQRGPCYRCMFPQAPKADEVQDCSESGVVGSITALVGAAQAGEVIRLLGRLGDDYTFGPTPGVKGQPHAGSMILFSPFSSPFAPYRAIRLRPRRLETCVACGDPDLVRASQVENSGREDVGGTIEQLDQVDYATFCGVKCESYPNHGQLERFEPQIFCAPTSAAAAPTVDVDVRSVEQYSIARLPNSYNIPMDRVRRSPTQVLDQLRAFFPPDTDSGVVRLLCRRGNDSLEAAHALLAAQGDVQPKLRFIDVRGGLQAYSREVDSSFPLY